MIEVKLVCFYFCDICWRSGGVSVSRPCFPPCFAALNEKQLLNYLTSSFPHSFQDKPTTNSFSFLILFLFSLFVSFLGCKELCSEVFRLFFFLFCWWKMRTEEKPVAEEHEVEPATSQGRVTVPVQQVFSSFFDFVFESYIILFYFISFSSLFLLVSFMFRSSTITAEKLVPLQRF